MDSETLFSLLMVVVVSLWAFSDNLPFRDEVTVYHLFCTEGLKQGQCKSKEETAAPTTYKIYLDQQTVVYWTGDNAAPNRLRHCAIRNNRNWSCQLGSEFEVTPKYLWQMVDGEFQEIGNSPTALDNNFYQTSKWRWWWVWLTEKTR